MDLIVLILIWINLVYLTIISLAAIICRILIQLINL